MPLSHKLLQVITDMGFEFGDGLSAERVRDGLAFAGVLGSITGVEEDAVYGNEGIIKIAAGLSLPVNLRFRTGE